MSLAGPQRGHQQIAGNTDIAIVGAGPAGLYAAWRLAHSPAFESQRITLFEATGATGGRVCTFRLPSVPFYVDIGAMRFAPSQVLVHSLIEEFFGQARIYPHDFPLASHFQRGRHILPARSQHPLKEFITEPRGKARRTRPQTAYRLGRFEDRQEPGALLGRTLGTALSRVTLEGELGARPGVTSQGLQKKLSSFSRHPSKLGFRALTVPEWQAVRNAGHFDNQPLFEMNLWDLVLRVRTNEGFKYIHDGVGYQSMLGAWNAAEHLLALFAESMDENFLSLRGGMDQLLKELEKQVFDSDQEPGAAKRELILRRSLSAVRIKDDGTFELAFDASGESPSDRILQEVWVARKVILALPKGALQEVQITGRELHKDLRPLVSGEEWRNILDSVVVSIPALKAAAYFSRPWWWEGLPAGEKRRLQEQGRVRLGEGAEFAASKIVTDLPIRQLYFHGPGGESYDRETGARSEVRGVVVAYCDASEVEYWSSVRSIKGGTFGDPNWLAKLSQAPNAEPAYNERAVGEPFKCAFMKYVGDVFLGVIPKKKIEEPLGIIFEDWSEAPTYGGWHGWRAGIKPWLLRELLAQPFEGAELYVCGEAWSVEQGWIEGAWRSVEGVLSRKEWGVHKPEWKTFAEHMKRSHFANFAEYVAW